MSQALSSFYPSFRVLEATSTKYTTRPDSVDALEKMLDIQNKGPSLAMGRLGPASYQEKAREHSTKIQGCTLHFWPSGTKRTDPTTIGHSRILIIGITSINAKTCALFRVATEALETSGGTKQHPLITARYTWNVDTKDPIYISSLETLRMGALFFQVPKPAVLSTLSPSLKLPVLKANEWRFLNTEMRSYPLHQLLAIALNDCIPKKGNSEHLSCPMLSPLGEPLYDGAYEVALIAGTTEQKLLQTIEKNTLIDRAMFSNDKVDPVTLEDFDKPYILNINGRTYSLATITSMVKEADDSDEPVRLEDGSLLTPEKIEQIKAWPNLTLSYWQDKEVTFKSEKYASSHPLMRGTFQPFSRSQDLPGLSSFMESLEPNEDGTWQARAIYNYYAIARGLTPFAKGFTETIQNITFKKIRFPSHYIPKTPFGHLVFKNVCFIDCIFDPTDWSGVSLKRVRFIDCSVIKLETGPDGKKREHLRPIHDMDTRILTKDNMDDLTSASPAGCPIQ